MAEKLRELMEEFRAVAAGRGRVLDAVVLPLLFVLLNALLGLKVALWGAMLAAVALTLFRLAKRQSIGYALGGLIATALASLLAWLPGKAEGYYIPSVIQGLATFLVALATLIIRRPLVAWTSHLARGWPLSWYWHPQVRPAYSEVTAAWALWFGLRVALQWSLYRAESPGLLAAFNLLSGWPATILLLAGSYLYGLWRLRRLQGPSVEEFKQAMSPPWTGQRRGF